VKGCLILENRRIFTGDMIGHCDRGYGEVVFHTGMTGYQEILTDPSYMGQIVVMTYPLIGNYGINPDDFESHRPWLTGFITAEACHSPNHYQSKQTLDAYLKANRIIGLCGVDTRALVREIRAQGTMKGWILPGVTDIKSFDSLEFPDLPTDQVARVTTPNMYAASSAGTYHVVVVDFGGKENIKNSLVRLGCKVTVVPARTSFETIQSLQPDGIMLTNGPGDPMSCVDVLPTIRKLAEHYPVFGICLGHQLLSLAFGAKTGKMRFGHRGSNHPVKDLTTGKVWITSQNHGYAVLTEDLPDVLAVTHVNVNDGTIEGVRHKTLPAFSVQYHPEACPGPKDSEYLFKSFMQLMSERREQSLVYAT
jgi:carbamoyl-phosphate synthase small subunit